MEAERRTEVSLFHRHSKPTKNPRGSLFKDRDSKLLSQRKVFDDMARRGVRLSALGLGVLRWKFVFMVFFELQGYRRLSGQRIPFLIQSRFARQTICSKGFAPDFTIISTKLFF
ncbi:hypothetical protein NL676_027913 [Syzygium grande]|nr:hypothetical protein NL676_027913 [Syzygium grande]